MRVATREQIERALEGLDLLPMIEQAFAGYSAGRAVVPPVGELLLEKGEVHIKYGYLRGDRTYVIKVASGFYGNAELGLPSSNGLMLVFEQRTGELACALLDEGRLTDVRTAVAGAVAAKHLAPKRVERIGIVGTGIQAHLQLEYLLPVVTCRDVLVWGRGQAQLDRYVADMAPLGFRIAGTVRTEEILSSCSLVVTTTPSKKPLLLARDLEPGTHITAVGADTPEKQELDAEILGRADVLVADSISQCRERGEIHQALKAGTIREEELVELGNVIAGRASGRTSEEQISVADLTGVAVQDVAIASAVFEALG